MIKKAILFLFVFTVAAAAAWAGSSDLAIEVGSSKAQYNDSLYRDREWDASLWGSYIFTENTSHLPASGADRYVEADHGFGGGLDLKYFFCRYVGVGLEGFGFEANRTERYISQEYSLPPVHHFEEARRFMGGGAGTVTLRFPIPNSPFAPYIFGGGGGIWGGGERERVSAANLAGKPPGSPLFYHHLSGSVFEPLAQVGGGFEIRLSHRIGLLNDFTWNIVNGRDNNFGMLRTGINLAF
jgi:hypothetical protein